jgi:acyl-CoA synthetase (AMP-forming)/AMP-acid ligase II
MKPVLLDRLAAHAAAAPREPALIFPANHRVLTWSELLVTVRAGAAALAERNVKPRDTVAIASSDPAEGVASFLAALAAGAVPSVAGEGGAANGEDVLFLQRTSGTTGAPKRVAVTRRMFERQAEAYAKAIALSAADRVVSWLPLSHPMGLVAALLIPLYHRVTSVHVSPFTFLEDPAVLFRLLAEHGGTLAWLPSFAFELCASRVSPEGLPRLTKLRALIDSSEPVRARTREMFLARFAGLGISAQHLASCYALAESTFAVTQTELGRAPAIDQGFVSCGRPIEGTLVRIGSAGEIEIDCSSAAGWCKTGDLGYLANGELFVTGRSRVEQPVRAEEKKEVAGEAGDELEAKLIAIWSRVLGRVVGVTDSPFLDHGGDSLAATRVAAEIAKDFGVRLEPSVLLEHDTIQLQATYLRTLGTAGNARRFVFPIKRAKRAELAPLVFIHPAGGEAFPYVRLARKLSDDRPVYAFESPERASDELLDADVHELAERYTKELLDTIPFTGGHLAGWSLGGTIAFEMASLLAARGVHARTVLLLDARAPMTLWDRTVAHAQMKLIRALIAHPNLIKKLPYVKSAMPESPARRFVAWLIAMDSPGRIDAGKLREAFMFAMPDYDRRALAGLDAPALIDLSFRTLENVTTEVERRELLFGYNALASLRRARLKARNNRLLLSYRPRSAYDGEVIALRVRDNPRVLGWQRYMSRPLRLLEADVEARPGLSKHWCFLDDVNADTLASLVVPALRAADANSSIV